MDVTLQGIRCLRPDDLRHCLRRRRLPELPLLSGYGLTGIVVTGEPPEPLPELPLPRPKSPPLDESPPYDPPLDDEPPPYGESPPNGDCGATVVTGAWYVGCSTGAV